MLREHDEPVMTARDVLMPVVSSEELHATDHHCMSEEEILQQAGARAGDDHCAMLEGRAATQNRTDVEKRIERRGRKTGVKALLIRDVV